jgi:hypothetical protein
LYSVVLLPGLELRSARGLACGGLEGVQTKFGRDLSLRGSSSGGLDALASIHSLAAGLVRLYS